MTIGFMAGRIIKKFTKLWNWSWSENKAPPVQEEKPVVFEQYTEDWFDHCEREGWRDHEGCKQPKNG
jgi:hypothetical protein